MMPTVSTQAPPATLAELEAQLQREMYDPGCPPQVSEATARTDARHVAHLRCPGCGLRSMEFHPYQRGRAYRILAGCTVCGVAEEV
jgi:hypothetical protein